MRLNHARHPTRRAWMELIAISVLQNIKQDIPKFPFSNQNRKVRNTNQYISYQYFLRRGRRQLLQVISITDYFTRASLHKFLPPPFGKWFACQSNYTDSYFFHCLQLQSVKSCIFLEVRSGFRQVQCMGMRMTIYDKCNCKKMFIYTRESSIFMAGVAPKRNGLGKPNVCR